MNKYIHVPVLLFEAVESLKVSNGKKYIDATAGGGGHTDLIIKMGGSVLAIDRDTEALRVLEEKFEGSNVVVQHGNFSDIKNIAEKNGYDKVDGILFDLGVSSFQLDASGRGFSIKKDEKLDMRMNSKDGVTAYDVVNNYPREKLIEIFYKYGEEHNAQEIARAIVEKRKQKAIETTKQLSDIIERLPHKSEAIHPATRVFQAIRIEVNQELENIKKGIFDALTLLNPNGSMVVISFHSLEDRIVKQMFDDFKKEGKGIIATKKPLTAGTEELKKNRRARSAKMRVFIKE